MAIQFENPLTAGTVLIRSAIQSQNYIPGIAGWIIEADGDAEFNNLVVRGTFQGTRFIINNNGMLFYSGVPANGNLIASIASIAGTDSFGNGFGSGVVTYDPVGRFFANLVGGAFQYGFLDGTGTPDISDGGQFGLNASGGVTNPKGVWVGPKSTLNPIQPAITLSPGDSTFVNGPSIDFANIGSTIPQNAGITGAWIKDNLSGIFESWHAMPYMAGWAAATAFNGVTNTPFPSMQYRKDAEDNCWINGLAQTTSTSGSIATLPAGYFNPNQRAFLAANFNISGVFSPGFVQVTETGLVNSSTTLGGKAVVSGSQIYINAKFPLGNIT
jgi:hypothetical protein